MLSLSGGRSNEELAVPCTVQELVLVVLGGPDPDWLLTFFFIHIAIAHSTSSQWVLFHRKE